MEDHSIFSSPKYASWPWMVCRSEEGQGALARCRAFQRRSVLAASWLPTQTKTLRTIQYFYSASSVLLQYWRVEWCPGKSFTKWPTAHYDPNGVQHSGSIWQMSDWHAKGLHQHQGFSAGAKWSSVQIATFLIYMLREGSKKNIHF